ncbi:MAG: branched-chain amino acid aminotransferase [Caulobacteraceae bacterium]|nr:branched-chain amino acid aminotransferase [Caulobacter sp.]
MALVPFDDRDGSIWLDGHFVPWRDAKIHVLTHGLHYASCVFEGQRIYDGRVFALEKHTERLFNSARLLDMTIPFTPEEINAACREAAEKSGMADAYQRPFVWRGSEQIGVSAPLAKIHVAIAVWAWPSYFDAEQKKKGIRLTNAPWRRPDPTTAPFEAKAAGLYMIATLSKHAAESAGYADALMLDYRGYVAEATGANVFFVKEGVIHTPTPDCFLNGITRQTVIGLARERGIEVVERHIKPEELADFSECFLTGSAAEVTPVSEIGEHRYTPGELSLGLMDAYARLVRRG